MDYGVSALEINLNGQNKGDGILYALSKPRFDQKNHQLVLENIENRPRRLTTSDNRTEVAHRNLKRSKGPLHCSIMPPRYES
jgi:hypothetical protein